MAWTLRMKWFGHILDDICWTWGKKPSPFFFLWFLLYTYTHSTLWVHPKTVTREKSQELKDSLPYRTDNPLQQREVFWSGFWFWFNEHHCSWAICRFLKRKENDPVIHFLNLQQQGSCNIYIFSEKNLKHKHSSKIFSTDAILLHLSMASTEHYWVVAKKHWYMTPNYITDIEFLLLFML